MALGRQVQHQVGIGILYRRCCGLVIGEIHPQQVVALFGFSQRLDTREIAGIVLLVKVEHFGVCVVKQVPHHGTADEFCANCCALGPGN